MERSVTGRPRVTIVIGVPAMLKLAQDFFAAVVRFDPNLNREQWIYVFIGLVVFGFFAMRGFGSRMNC